MVEFVLQGPTGEKGWEKASDTHLEVLTGLGVLPSFCQTQTKTTKNTHANNAKHTQPKS